MQDEVAKRRRWLDDQRFLDLVGATNLIPGPNSTEMAIHIGFARGRWRGLFVAGLCLILLATAIVLELTISYVRCGSTPRGRTLLDGIEPVVIAVLLQALVRLGRTTVKGPGLALIGAAALGLYLAGVNELLVLFGGTAAYSRPGPGEACLSAPGGAGCRAGSGAPDRLPAPQRPSG